MSGNNRGRIEVRPLSESQMNAWSNGGRHIPPGWTALADAKIGTDDGVLIQHNQTLMLSLLHRQTAIRSVPQRKALQALTEAGIPYRTGAAKILP